MSLVLYCRAVTELAHERTRILYCITDRRIQNAHKNVKVWDSLVRLWYARARVCVCGFGS
jgi:hypothetical protein